MTRKPPKGKSLAELNPKLAQQWHTSKNGDLTPFDFTAKSGTKVWWQCDKGYDHEWESAVYSRAIGTGCPVCAGQKVVLSNCLATLNPELVSEWHTSKNGDLTPFDFTAKSGTKVWWQCDKGYDHEWEATIGSRVNQGHGCPICSGRLAVLSNCLATLNPELVSEWHPTKNGKLTPYKIRPNSGKKIWWKCDKGDDHEWKSAPDTRVSQNQNCPICAGQKVVLSNCLATLNPELVEEWHQTKNGTLTPFNVTTGTQRKVWWQCDKEDDHEWKAAVNHRTNGTGCPFCRGLKVTKSNCLATTHSEICQEWHPIKNSELTSYDIVAGSNKKVWWKCDKGDDHEWESSPGTRISQNQNCPVCAGKKVVNSNCLATTHPELAKQWHPTKNGSLTTRDVVAGTSKRIWWKCNKDENHVWKVSGNSRDNFKTECPFCTLTPQSKQELTITFELIIFFKDINPKGFKTSLNGKLTSVDIYIPELKLGIEFDGNYWHKDNAAFDKLKTEQLEDEGFEIFRVREEPLEKLFDDDIMSKQPFNPKQVVNDLLTQIMSRYSLNTKKITKIESYIAKKELQNEKGLDKYIDMILTEKAEKKL